MKKITLLKSLLVVMTLSLFSFSAIAEEVLAYTINFENTRTSDDSNALTTSNFISKAIKGGTEYVSACTQTEKCYEGNSALKLGTSSKTGSFTLSLSDEGKVKASKVVVYTKKYSSDTGKINCSINGGTAVSITPGNAGECSINNLISTITISTTAKRAYVVKIEVYTNLESGDLTPGIFAGMISFGTLTETNQSKILTVTGANLTNAITATLKTGTAFELSGELTKEGGDLTVKFIATAAGTYSDEIILTSGETTKTIEVSATLVATEGNGTKEDPYTCADVKLLNNSLASGKYWVKGYILGSLDNNKIAETNVNSNLALGATADAGDFVPVQLPSGNVRTALNLVDNPTLLGREVLVYGNFENYFSKPGVKNVEDYVILEAQGGEGGEDDAIVAQPQFSVASKKFTEPFNLTLSCATEGAEIYYTLEEAGEFVKYTEPLNITETTTVYAKAVLGEEESEVVSATYTYVAPVVVTIAEFLKAEVNDDILYELTGVVYDIYNTQYGNFYLTNETDTILVYGLKANATAGNQTFAQIEGLEEGDTLTLRGYRADYKGTAQVGSAYYVSHINYVEPAPAITAVWNIEEGATVEDLTSATLTFTGVESVKSSSMYVFWFYEKNAEGEWQLVENMCNAGILDATVSGVALTLGIDPGCYSKDGETPFYRKGEYRIVVPVGGVYFNGDKTNLNTEEYVLNFVIDNDIVEPEEIDAVYTVAPENNSTLTEIREFVLTFTEYETIAVAELDLVMGSNIPQVYIVDTFTGALMPVGYIFFKADSLSTNALRLYVEPNFNGGLDYYALEGVYTIRIPAGVVSFGENRINKEIILNYTVKELLSSTLTGFDFGYDSDRAIYDSENSVIYYTNPNCSIHVNSDYSWSNVYHYEEQLGYQVEDNEPQSLENYYARNYFSISDVVGDDEDVTISFWIEYDGRVSEKLTVRFVKVVAPATPEINRAENGLVELTCIDEDAKILYTVVETSLGDDLEDVTDVESFMEYTESFELTAYNAVITVYAVAIRHEFVYSDIVYKSYTFDASGKPVEVENIAMSEIYTENGMIMAEGEFQIFTVTGQNVTDMNGNLVNGVYVVRTANATTKVVIK